MSRRTILILIWISAFLLGCGVASWLLNSQAVRDNTGASGWVLAMGCVIGGGVLGTVMSFLAMELATAALPHLTSIEEARRYLLDGFATHRWMAERWLVDEAASLSAIDLGGWLADAHPRIVTIAAEELALRTDMPADEARIPRIRDLTGAVRDLHHRQWRRRWAARRWLRSYATNATRAFLAGWQQGADRDLQRIATREIARDPNRFGEMTP